MTRYTIIASDVRAFTSTEWAAHFSGATVDFSEFSDAALRAVQTIAGENGDSDLCALVGAELDRRID